MSALAAQDFRGSLVGTVTDASGGRIQSAAITLHAAASSVTRETTSDARGEFRFDDLLPGAWRATVKAAGFAEARADVTVAISSTREIAVTLHPAPVAQSVTVPGQASSIATQPMDTTSDVQGGVVTAHDLAAIPLAHRSFANIAFLVPGTEPVEPSDPTKARITAVSFGGSSGLNDVLSVDGGDNSDDYIGGFLQNFSPDAIQEFAVRTAQEDADTGRTVGGSVVITTKHGTNDWHGDLAFYDRAAALDARYPIENPAPLPKQPFSRQNYIATVGGPVVKDKVWFFASFEHVHEDASIAYSPASLTQFDALASLAGQGLIPGVSSIGVPDSVPVPFRDFLGTMRFDWAQSTRSTWFLRAAIDNYVTDNAFVQQATLPSTGADWHSNYMNVVVGQQYIFSPTWLGTLTLDASLLHLTEARNSTLGFALAFPFSSTSQTISGFETFGDNQFVTPITAFPILRNQEKYQVRYALTHTSGRHSPSFGVDFIHEPVMSGALPGNAENLTVFAQNPADYLANPAQFAVDLTCTPAGGLDVTPGTDCSSTPSGNGSFAQNVQRLGFYAQDSWRATSRLTVNYGLRYDRTFGLFTASGRSQWDNPALLTVQALQIPLFAQPAVPHDYSKAFAPRLGLAYAMGNSRTTVLRAGFGLFYNDLAQNGWVTAFQAVNEAPAPCTVPGDAGCLPGDAYGGAGALIDPGYKTPYALHATAGVDHAFNSRWMISADWTHEAGVHSYARYQYQAGYTLFSPLFPNDTPTQQQNVPDLTVFRSDNRSRYDGLSVHLQGQVARRLSLIFNYTLSRAYTFGCVLGELFDYVDGVCNPLHAFGKGDSGPSGENVTHRAVVAGTWRAPGGFEFGLLGQAESARPFTMTTPVDVNGFGDTLDDRAVVNGVQTTLDEFRGKPYLQFDMRVSRPLRFGDNKQLMPFIEFFNLFNRNNPGANYVTNVAAFPLPVDNQANVTAFCLNAACTQTQPITSLNQLRVPAGALGDFFGPGTTVGIPFAAQIGVRFTF
ncbi:MAG TPA: carboxypeptidase regulatory-like domain-containing protein [Bryobacteraceae bacterium]|nr:carboxypeptidase regulatory-like domain-containing protein [Bryobacteraceae bacterium]